MWKPIDHIDDLKCRESLGGGLPARREPARLQISPAHLCQRVCHGTRPSRVIVGSLQLCDGLRLRGNIMQMEKLAVWLAGGGWGGSSGRPFL